MYYILVILFVIFLFSILCLFIGIFTGLIYAAFHYYSIKYPNKININTKRRVKHLLIALTVLIATYHTYTAFYPTDSFYYDEFKRVTLREIPKSARIIEKEASYPDFHGDYSSECKIKLSKEDYLKLFNAIIKDKRFGKVSQSGYLKIRNQYASLIFERNEIGNEDCYLQISFLIDKETILVNVDQT